MCTAYFDVNLIDGCGVIVVGVSCSPPSSSEISSNVIQVPSVLPIYTILTTTQTFGSLVVQNHANQPCITKFTGEIWVLIVECIDSSYCRRNHFFRVFMQSEGHVGSRVLPQASSGESRWWKAQLNVNYAHVEVGFKRSSGSARFLKLTHPRLSRRSE